MLKLFKYLKPFTVPLLLAIALLYGQAMADLALPDYMSNIVNVGIQQAGVDHSIPKVIKESELSHLELFLTEDESQALEGLYEKITPSDASYNEYESSYTNLENETIYVISDEVSEEVESALEVSVSKAVLSVSGLDKMISDANGGDIQFGDKTLPAGTDLFKLLGMMSAEQRAELSKDSSDKFAEMGDSMVVQAGAKQVQVMYEDLGADTEKMQRNYILKMGGIMLFITLLGAISSIAVGYISAKVAAGLGRNLRKHVFEKVSKFTNAELDTFSTSSLITRSTNDISQIQNLMVIMIRMVFYAPIMGVGGVIRAMDKNSSMSWIIAVAVGALLLVIVIVFSIALPKFKMVQKLVDRMNLVSRESLSGMMVIRAFNTQGFEEKRFDDANKDLTDTNLFVNRVMVFMFPMMMVIMNGVTLMIIWVGAHQIADAQMQVGDMMAFMQYAIQIIFSFLMLSMMFILIPRAAISAGRIAEVLETDATIKDPTSPKALPAQVKGTLQFNKVSFRYPGAEEDMIKSLSFTAQAGKTTAIIGSTGSGKTTMVNLIPRFYDVSEGSITLDGTDIRELTQHDLRSVIGYVPQKASLFSGTIESNLRFAKEDATQEELQTAAEIAQAMDFINEKNEGFASEISQGGTNVSGGQKQRLAIARALVKKPKVFIFDDSFSALDFKTDSALRSALAEHSSNSTLIIVAQRISTIKNADQIIVLEDGKLAGIGTHQNLMENCDTYREIALSQLSKEELA